MTWDNVNRQFGNILRRLRKDRGLSQLQFSELCSMDPTYYGRIERGEHSTTLNTCCQIADALGLTLSELFEDVV